ncbi:cohesin domain-containing protein [Acidobacteria bacterium AH-259-D05]|nr:cohesin domain-containing protein [Acidobacteria bacterium AH-259-D05]
MSILLAMTLISLSLVPGIGAATTQEEVTPSRRAARLDLGFGQSPPGSHVSIPITLTLPRGVEIGSATNEITFPAQLLSFQEATKGLAAEVAEAEVTTEVTHDDQDPESSILKVTIEGKAGMAIPRGVLVDLIFNISEQAQLGETIMLKNAASAVSPDDPPQPIDPVTGNDGEIVIDETAIVFACFFFMH